MVEVSGPWVCVKPQVVRPGCLALVVCAKIPNLGEAWRMGKLHSFLVCLVPDIV